ncbi:MAG: protein kinase [Planctomycetota bacterium]
MDEREIFEKAIDLESDSERNAFLDEACRENAGLKQRVEELLRAHCSAENFPPFQTGAILGSTLDETRVREGESVGPYKLLQLLGTGGMGQVFMAEQLEPIRRRVAVKVIKDGQDSRRVIARFEAERQALALMDHPNIASVFDAGRTDSGVPYFVMELIKGVPITKFCDDNRIPTQERLKLFGQVCSAVQHAHQRGIIHRDLKPSNVLVAEYDEDRIPKIIDFGIAKALHQPLTEKTLFTEVGTIIGTLEYMSPEQAKLNQLDVDTRSDVYSLGVLLYELLTGETPIHQKRFRECALDEMLRVIREEEPVRPSLKLSKSESLPSIAASRLVDPKRLSRILQGELDWIVLKALEKERSRRYESAHALAADLANYLADSPVQACPPTLFYRVGKFVRNHKMVASLATLVISTIIVVAIVATLVAERFRRLSNDLSGSLVREEESRLEAEELASTVKQALIETERHRQEVLQNLYVAQMKLAAGDWESQNIARFRQTLDHWRPLNQHEERRGWEWYYLNSLLQRELLSRDAGLGEIRRIRFCPDGSQYAVAGDKGVHLIDSVSNRVIRQLRGRWPAAWSSDGKQIVTQGSDSLLLWDAESGTDAEKIPTSPTKWGSICWSPIQPSLAVGQDNGIVEIWDTESRILLTTIESGVDGEIRAMDWSHDGTTLAVGGNYTGKVNLLDVSTGEIVRSMPIQNDFIWDLAWAPDDKSLVAANADMKITLWNAKDGSEVFTSDQPQSAVLSLAYSPDGRRIATSEADGGIRVIESSTGNLLNHLKEHEGRGYSVAWSPSGRTLYSGGKDGVLRAWDAKRHQGPLQINAGTSFAWNPSGDTVLSVLQTEKLGTGSIRVFDSHSGVLKQTIAEIPRAHWWNFTWSPDGKWVAYSVNLNTVEIRDAKTWEVACSMENVVKPERFETEGIRAIAWSPDGKCLAVGGTDRRVHILNPLTRMCTTSLQEHDSVIDSIQFSPDGLFLAARDFRQKLVVWDIKTWEVRQRFEHKGFGAVGQHGIAWHPEESQIACGTTDGRVHLYDILKRKLIRSVHGHSTRVRSLSWSSDGLRIASGSEDGHVKVWDPRNGMEMLSLKTPGQGVTEIQWSPDSRKLAACSFRGLTIWDATLGAE